MARAMNAIGYDAVALGNHEFNYGLPLLGHVDQQMDARAGANAVHAGTDRPAYRRTPSRQMQIRATSRSGSACSG